MESLSKSSQNGLTPISDLFSITRYLKPSGKVLNERAGLIKYFHEHARNKLDDKFDVSYIGMILAHLKLQDLYYLKSLLESETKRGGNWNKIFFGSLYTPKTR